MSRADVYELDMNVGSRRSSSSSSSPERNVPLKRLEDDADLSKLYEFGRKLGRGSYGAVYEATFIKTLTKWAIKVIPKAPPGSLKCKMLWQEIEILQQLSHTHIIHLHEVYITAKMIYLVTELCEGGDLGKVLQQKSFFTEDETRQTIWSLTDAVAHLHRKGIMHRDLKLQNILVKTPVDEENSRIHIKVADFGLSVQTQAVWIESRTTDVCGTLAYMAPEVMSCHGYSQWCDVWSIGVIMYILLCGEHPYVSRTKETLLKEINTRGVTFPQSVWASVSDAAKTTVTYLLKEDPAHRLTAQQLLHSPWITGDTHATAIPLNVLELMSRYRKEEQMLRSKEEEEKDKPTKPTCDGPDTPGPSSTRGPASTAGKHNSRAQVGLHPERDARLCKPRKPELGRSSQKVPCQHRTGLSSRQQGQRPRPSTAQPGPVNMRDTGQRPATEKPSTSTSTSTGTETKPAAEPKTSKILNKGKHKRCLMAREC